jgi:hypothetical protein
MAVTSSETNANFPTKNRKLSSTTPLGAQDLHNPVQQ